MKKRISLILVFSAIFAPPVFADSVNAQVGGSTLGQMATASDVPSQARVCDNLGGDINANTGQQAAPGSGNAGASVAR